MPHDIPPRRPAIVLGPDAPRSASGVRAAGIHEGVATLLAVPLVDGHDLHGMLYLAHEHPYHWRDADLEAAEAMAGDAAIAVRSARTYGRTAAWAAQLQSIQRLGARLSGLADVSRIGHAIATELRQLIDYHNIRVYRVAGDELIPVAMLGRIGPYVDETADQLRVAMGEGITGWVARYRVPQLVDDSAHDPRVVTIPGTEAGVAESLLLAPMVHEGQCLGVLVLAKLGLRQFTEDDLRLLVIYASFAAQAMANADVNGQLERQSASLARQLRAQQELMRTTESILTTLDQRAVLDQLIERIGSLIECDNMAIEVVERPTGLLVPLMARGIHAAEYMAPWEPGETGITTWVVDHNEPVLIEDERSDPRVNHFSTPGTLDGSLIVVPLTGPHGAAGVLTLERLGPSARFDEEEFELVKLFAGQVSIALRNAASFQAAEIRARTDDLTGLLNHGTFKSWLARSVAAAEPFGLVMIDLDGFKAVNDTLGHQAGDRLLREIAASLVRAARDSDAVFRYGGDEFVVILPRTGPAGVGVVAERILGSVDGVNREGGEWERAGLHIATSIGTASYPEDGEDAERVLLAADRACFVAKRRGRGRIATAADAAAVAGDFTLTEPTPVDPPRRGDAA